MASKIKSYNLPEALINCIDKRAEHLETSNSQIVAMALAEMFKNELPRNFSLNKEAK